MEEVNGDLDIDHQSLLLALTLQSSSTALRRAELQKLNQKLKENELAPQLQPEVLYQLFKTYPVYHDRGSRHAVQKCLYSLLLVSEKCFSVLVSLLKLEAAKAGIASSSAFVLTEWCSVAIQSCALRLKVWDTDARDLIDAYTQLLELCVSSSARPSVQKSAFVVTRRALRTLFKATHDDVLSAIISQLCMNGPLGYRPAVLLGVVASVCSRSFPKKAVLKNNKGQYYAFWIREVVGSRSAVPTHISTAFHDFFSSFTSIEDLRNEIVPALEKALLRAPEVVLDDLTTCMALSLQRHIDLSDLLANRLLKPLLSNVKSSNLAIREGVISSFAALIERSHDSKLVGQISNDILTPLAVSKISAPEQRVLHSRMLSLLSLTSAQSAVVCDDLVGVVMKESIEAALAAETNALIRHLSLVIEQDSGNVEAAITALLHGLGDKRVAFQRIWALRSGGLLWWMREKSIMSPLANRVVEAVLPKLLELFNEVIINPLSAAQKSAVVAAYIMIGLYDFFLTTKISDRIKVSLRKCNVYEKATTVASKPAFLLSHRILSKLSASEDLVWAVRAVAACSIQTSTHDLQAPSSNAWAQAYLYLASASSIPFNVRREATRTLTEVYAKEPTQVASTIVKGLWIWCRNLEMVEKDTAALAAQTGDRNLFSVIQAISPPSGISHIELKETDVESLQKELIDLLVLCRPEIIPRSSWIEICLKRGQDPGTLVQAHGRKCLDKINTVLQENSCGALSRKCEIAAYNAAAELAFVAPGAILPMLIKQIQEDLSIEELRLFGPNEIAIARTPDGTLFVNVLAKKPQSRILDKNARDYDTLKWDDDVRNQLDQKKGQQKKLSPEEQAQIDGQLSKEAAMRKKVLQLETKLRRGIGMVHGLVRGPPTDAGIWIGPSLKAVLDVITTHVGLLLGNAADELYISCATYVSSRLGSIRPSIGVATLRALGCSRLPEEFEQEPLGDLVTRLLYRLRLASEQRAFDSVSLNYMLPLVLVVLRQHGIGHSDTDEANEQVTLALEFLSFHTDAFFNIGLPREEILSVLIQSMQEYSQHYKIIKDCILELCRAVAPTISSTELVVILRGTLLPQTSVRTVLLQAVRAELDLTDLDFCDEIWLANYDDVSENAELGQAIWQENALETEPVDALKMVPYLASTDRQLRRAASKALVACISEDRSVFIKVLETLKEQYIENAKPRLPDRDKFGMSKKANLRDPWERRSGVALAFKELAQSFSATELVPFVQFLISESAVGDRNPTVRDEMIESATTVIAAHGSEKVEELMTMFKDALEISNKNSEVSDLVSEAVVVLYGALARHLSMGDPRVPDVVQRLLLTLSTPSETVQYAVAECLPPLIRTSSQKTPEYVQQLLDQLFKSKQYATRRGAAYGLAGIVSGAGIAALREYRILSALKGAIENKKDQNPRQGALFAFELLSLILGRIFEPYIIQIVPQLLSSFGDSSGDVREACLDAARTCFASLSSYGVRRILPTLLEGLEEHQWRSKKGACDLLGAMAYLDPQQLALSLPKIIPPLTNVLNDSHKEVRLAANKSLQRFGEVISNPEVKAVIDILLKALSDPTKYTDEALDALIKVSFIHYLDAPSLALVVRILERGLGDRSATKRKSAQIIGSLAHLTERKDLISHLPILVSGLKLAVVDPVPTTRATASKALGSLVEKLGEDALPDLIPGLMSTLKSETGAGDRLGSAQALSEVLAGLGTGRLEETLPTILQNVASSKPTVREGFMSLFIYLPACFGNSFATYLKKIIPPILSGLADDIESIRDTSLRAGRLLVKNFAAKAIDLLLPELDRGLADDNHRIRLSSVELVGDLLFNLTGISGNAGEDEEEGDGAVEAGQSLLEVLGEDKRNKILSSLYICRCDTSGLVRTAAINVWKALVATPKTLKELVPTLTQVIIRRLASSNMESKVIASNALGELIRKTGEGVLASLLPTLEDGLQTSTDVENKQGICIALREIISSSSLEILDDYEQVLISVVRTALVDQNDEVREAAAEAFDSLQKIFGKKAVDHVLPYLLNLLRTENEADTALSALLTLLTDHTRSNIILPNLIPTLLTSPISSFNAKAIASLSEVAGSAMTRRLPVILNALMEHLIACKDDELRSDLDNSFNAILLSVDEFDGLNTAMSVLLALMQHDDHRKRALANLHLGKFVASTEVDFSRYNQDLIRALLISFDDRDWDVVKAAWTALSELTKGLRKEEMESLVFSSRQVLQQVGVAGSNLPGFSLPKGINAILPIFLQGLMNGTAEQRTQSALAISDIIDRTNADALKPFVTQMTGPLIRVVSERSVDVKSAILFTLNNLLERIPAFLKPFLPQLQRTFAKSLADPTSELLRSRAAKALGTLITLTPRVDPLIAELVTGTKTSDTGVHSAMLKALYEVVSRAGVNMSETSRNSVLGLIDSGPSNIDDTMSITNARLLGALIKNLPTINANGLIKHRVLTTNFSHVSVLSLNAVLVESASSLLDTFPKETMTVICQGIKNRDPYIKENCVLAAGKYLLAVDSNISHRLDTSILEALATAIEPGNPADTRRLSLVVVRTLCRQHIDIVRPYIYLLAPPIFASVRDPIIPIKLAAEAAFLTIFSVAESKTAIFDKYMADAGEEFNSNTKRSIQDYFKRVALRLGTQARERKDAEGGQGSLGLLNDEREDEREIWSIGKVDLEESTPGND